MDLALIFIITGGTIWVVTHVICQYRLYLAKIRLEQDSVKLQEAEISKKLSDSAIQILSDSCTNHLISMVQDYQQESSKAMTDFMSHAADLLERLEKKTTTTV